LNKEIIVHNESKNASRDLAEDLGLRLAAIDVLTSICKYECRISKLGLLLLEVDMMMD